jgi:hypothetical protein
LTYFNRYTLYQSGLLIEVAGNMLKRILDRISGWRWDFVNLHPIAMVPWSAIRRIGQSRLLALTIAVPFLGSFLLFNHHVIQFLSLSPDIIGRWHGIPTSEAGGLAHQLTLSRLYYLYFGLSFLGAGSAIFTLFCPLEIKNYPSPVEYLQVESPLVTKPRMGLLVDETAEQYSGWWGDDDGVTPVTARLSYPTKFMTLGYAVILEIFADAARDQENYQPQDPSEDAAEGEDDDYGDFYDFRGRVDAGKIAKVLHAPNRVQLGFISDFSKAACLEKNRGDALLLHYLAMDYKRPGLRAFVSSFYALGFSLLLVPTLITFVHLVFHLIAH